MYRSTRIDYVCCNTLKTLKYTATHCNTLKTLQYTATHWRHCNTQQYTATHTLQHFYWREFVNSPIRVWLQHTVCCSVLQCVAVCCRAGCCSMCCSVSQCVAVRHGFESLQIPFNRSAAVHVLQCIAVYCSVFSVLQRQNPCDFVQRVLYSIERVLYLINRAIYCVKRAMYFVKRDPYLS